MAKFDVINIPSVQFWDLGIIFGQNTFVLHTIMRVCLGATLEIGSVYMLDRSLREKKYMFGFLFVFKGREVAEGGIS